MKQPPQRNRTLIVASLGVFMTALDTPVVTTALPMSAFAPATEVN